MLKTALTLFIFAVLAFAQQKTTQVRSYTKKDGTHVDSYTRKVPTGKSSTKKGS
jgi:hypothetical protein